MDRRKQHMKQTKAMTVVLTGALAALFAVQVSAREVGHAAVKTTKLIKSPVIGVETYKANKGQLVPSFEQKAIPEPPVVPNDCPKADVQVLIAGSEVDIIGTPCHDRIDILFDGAKNIVEAKVMNLKGDVVLAGQFELPSEVTEVFADLKGGDDEFTYSIEGGRLNCTVDGGAGDDTLLTSGGGDTLIGGEGSDTLDAGPGVNTLIGGNGADEFYVLSGSNAVYAADGIKDDIFHGTNADNNSVESDDVDEEIFE
jgi:hypothetical protein